MHKPRTMRRFHRRMALSLGRKLPAITADVSLDGFQAELPQVFLPGSKVHGYLLLGENEAPFAGEVVWARPGNPQLSVMSRVGVRFAATPDGLKKFLARR